MRKTKKNFKGYPGDEYRLAICDLCGCKRHIKDMKYIDADYNRSNGVLICHEHPRPTNPQDIPIVIEEDYIQDPRYIRSEPAIIMQAVIGSNILPTAPRMLRAVANTVGTGIRLTWLGPSNTGSSPIIGYIIQVAYPQYGTYVTLIANTDSETPFYLDNITNMDTYVSYKVAAISELGTGPYSEEAPYPANQYTAEPYYIATDDLYVIAEDDGTFIAEG